MLFHFSRQPTIESKNEKETDGTKSDDGCVSIKFDGRNLPEEKLWPARLCEGGFEAFEARERVEPITIPNNSKQVKPYDPRVKKETDTKTS